jgi:dienelactone hydrolase
VGAGAATVLETELTAASIRHNLKAYPRATHVFFDDQLRLPPGRGRRHPEFPGWMRLSRGCRLAW